MAGRDARHGSSLGSRSDDQRPGCTGDDHRAAGTVADAQPPAGSTGTAMSRLDEVGERDTGGAGCAMSRSIPEMSVNDGRGPSIDSPHHPGQEEGQGSHRPRGTARPSRLQHHARGRWPRWCRGRIELFVVEPAPIIATVERLQRKGGREVVARCPTQVDGEEAATWLVDRISRLNPDLAVTAEVEPGGGQFLLVLRA